MKSLIMIITQMLIISFLLQGCDKSTEAENPDNKKHLSNFLGIHSQYCEKAYKQRSMLIKALKNDPNLTISKDYDDVYESIVDKVSYGISAEENGCTTDVLLKTAFTKRALISLEAIESSLTARGYKRIGTKKTLYEEGWDGTKVKITDIEFMSNNQEHVVLSYPLEKTDKFYMTLWIEKYSQ